MAISKSKREEVYQKYNGHCAYCGREIAYKDMQVDHFLPLRAWGIEDTGTISITSCQPAGCAITISGQTRLRHLDGTLKKSLANCATTTSTRLVLRTAKL